MASKCQIHVRSRQRTYFSFFMPPNSFYKPLNFLLYETNTFFRVCVLYAGYIDVYRSQKTSQRVKNNSHATRLCFVSYFFVLYAVTSSVTYYNTHRKKM